MKKTNEIFIQVKGVGFTFLLDKRMKHNLISPALLAFFNLGEISSPFLSDYVDSVNFGEIFHYVGKKVGRCRDNKLRVCKVFMLGFEYEGYTFSFPFLLDNSLDEPAILGLKSYNKLTRLTLCK